MGNARGTPAPGEVGRQPRSVNPRDAELAYHAGLQALNAMVEDEGLRVLDAAIRAHPRDARLWQVKGLLHRSLEDLGPAIRAFRQAAQLAPADLLIAHSLARVHLEAGRPSAHLFRAARSLGPRNGEIILGHAAALAAEGGTDAAIEELDRALTENPGWLPGHDTLCRLRFQAGDRSHFTASLDRALTAYPQDITLWRTLLVMLTQSDLYEHALEQVSRGRTLAGDNLLFDVNEAACRSELGHVAEADRLFARLSNLEEPSIRVREVRHLLRTGRFPQAAELGLRMVQGPAAHMFWPYLATAWRLTADARWEWLEGDPRLVGVYDLGKSAPPLPALAKRLRSLHLARNQPLEQSVRGGTQTDGALFARVDPEIRKLREAIAKAVERHVAQLPPPDPQHPLLAAPRDRRIRFSGSWSVRLVGQGYHSNHVHPAGWFSSAFYVALPDAAMGGEPQAGWLTLGEPQSELGLDLPPFRMIEPKPGRLVLFPSTMWHGTRPFGSGERLTVAFDVKRPV